MNLKKDFEQSNEIQQREENPFKQLMRKIFIRFLALFLMVLFISYLAGNYALEYVASRSESVGLNQETLVFQDAGKIIVFEKEVYNQLQKIYLTNQEHEFKVCLFGTRESETYHITSFIEPKLVSRSPFHVSAELCDPKAIIDLHSHPFEKCIASAVDIAYLHRLKQRNQDALMAVMCEKERMSFYTADE
ncbi:MAG: hypothetical protein AABW64_02825 [Nanoarchaeota archaeon]